MTVTGLLPLVSFFASNYTYLIMRRITTIFALLLSVWASAQESTGSVAGKMTDADFNDEPLAFANVLIKGTTMGATSDFDGLYEISGLEPGDYVVVFSYVGYETREVPVLVEAGKVSEVNVSMAASAQALDEVVVTVVRRQDSQVAQLLAQKKAVTVVESIGAKELGRLNVSDAASATEKIAGVTSSEASGDIFVRGLGDRYLSTTLNGLPVPSDDVEKKNIDLALFPTRVINNVGISKTYGVQGSADVSSGAINIASKELAGESDFSIGFSSGINTNVAQNGVFDNFRVSPNYDDTSLGFYSQDNTLQEQILQQSWNTIQLDNPVDYGVSLTAGKKFFDNKLALLFSGSHSRSFGYQNGLFRQFRSNFIDDTITDAVEYNTNIVNTALFDATYFINEKNKIRSTTFFINKYKEELFEGGRDGESTIFEETNPGDGLFQFIRDQNIKQTRVFVTQLMATHRLSDQNTLEWKGSYNQLTADEPNRIRNEINFDPTSDFVEFGFTGGFQQRKSSQEIEDIEFNGVIKDIMQIIDEENTKFKIEVGASYRNKERDFASEFVGVEETTRNAVAPPSIDDIGSVFTTENFNNGNLQLNLLGLNENGDNQDIYTGSLESKALFADFTVSLGRWNFNTGFRLQEDNIAVNYDIGNLFPRTGESIQDYSNLYPTLNVKYQLDEEDKQALRLGISRTVTLPEFKEIAPFEYVAPTGQITAGNPDIQGSQNLNIDLKYEFFPTPGQVISVATFFKDISNPINRALRRGSAGIFSYFNTSDNATVSGIEVESKLDIFKSDESDDDGNPIGDELGIIFNATRMWHNQDLREFRDENGNLIRSFRYSNITETGLQGASDWILNTSLLYNTRGKNPFSAAVTANYADDKIFSLGVPTDQANLDLFYNDAIIEKGFVVLDAVVSKEFGENWKVQISGRNLLDPDIRQTQKVLQNVSDLFALTPEERLLDENRIEKEETVRSYTLGRTFSISLNYKF